MVKEEVKEGTEQTKSTVANEIWNDIKNLPMSMFSLPEKPLSTYAQPQTVEPSKCYLKLAYSSVLPALEEVFKKEKRDYTVEQTELFTIVSK